MTPYRISVNNAHNFVRLIFALPMLSEKPKFRDLWYYRLLRDKGEEREEAGTVVCVYMHV